MRHRSRLGAWVAAAAAAAWLGCAPAADRGGADGGRTGRPDARRGASASGGAPAYDVRDEGWIPPLDSARVRLEPDVEELALREDTLRAEEVSAPAADGAEPDGGRAAAGPPGGPAGVLGRDGSVKRPVFRVQVLALGSREAAEAAAAEARARLGFPVYVEAGEGVFRVRVGDFKTRLEAEKARRRCREAGYADAWIVTSVFSAPAPGR